MLTHLTPTDLPALVHLNRQVQQLHVNLFPDTFRPPEDGPIGQFFSDMITQPDNYFLGAFDDQRMVGYIFCRYRKNPGHAFKYPAKVLYLDQICVDEDHRRSGVATTLLAEVKSLAMRLHADRIELDTYAINDVAKAAFSKLGSRTVTERMVWEGNEVSR